MLKMSLEITDNNCNEVDIIYSAGNVLIKWGEIPVENVLLMIV